MNKEHIKATIPARREEQQVSNTGGERRIFTTIKGLVRAVTPPGLPASADVIASSFFALFRTQPDLINCTEASLIRAAFACASTGLVPGAATGEAYVFPFKVKGQLEAQFILGYRGMISLAGRNGWTVRAVCVAKGDAFIYEEGLEPRLVHSPKRYSPARDEITHVYAVAKHTDGRASWVVLDVADVEKRRKSARSGDSPAWRDWYSEMALKTAIRQLFKRLPLAPAISIATDYAHRVEHGEAIGYDATPLLAAGMPAVAEALDAGAREPGDDGDDEEVTP